MGCTYGYLFVDFKPNQRRLRKNVLPGEEKFNFSSHDSFQTLPVWSHSIQISVTNHSPDEETESRDEYNFGQNRPKSRHPSHSV